eukprot:7581997-Ditylum_brightwellii.AAC.1
MTNLVDHLSHLMNASCNLLVHWELDSSKGNPRIYFSTHSFAFNTLKAQKDGNKDCHNMLTNFTESTSSTSKGRLH